MRNKLNGDEKQINFLMFFYVQQLWFILDIFGSIVFTVSGGVSFYHFSIFRFEGRITVCFCCIRYVFAALFPCP